MIIQNILLAIRRMFRQRLHTGLNVTGMALGLGAFLLIGLYITNEWSFDRYHRNGDRIYRLVNMVEGSSYSGGGIAKVTYPWGTTALEEVPEVEDMCRFLFAGNALVETGKEQFYEPDGFYADPSVFELFDWKLLAGQPENVLQDPMSIVVTKSFAERCFGSKDPIGKTITLDHDQNYQVTGVVEDVPSNSHFTFQFLLSLKGYDHPDLLSWVRWNQFYTYLMLKPGTQPETVEAKFAGILKEHLDSASAAASTPLLQPLASIHLQSHLHREIAANGNASTLWIFASIAVFILLIACLNFINLTTSVAMRRGKEVGVRKSIGASRGQLVRQNLLETFLLCLAGALLGAVLAQLALPSLNAFLNRELQFDWLHHPELVLGFLGLVGLIALISGLYPAMISSTYRPAQVIQGQEPKPAGIQLRKVLVVFQFLIALFLMVASVITWQQVNFMQHTDMGFDPEQIIVVPMPSQDVINHAETFKSAFRQVPGIVQVSASANRPGGSDYGVPYKAIGLTDQEQPEMRCLTVDYDFLETYGMEVAQGRAFNPAIATDSAAYMINEEAARQLGWSDPMEHQLAMPAVNRPAGPIVGVLKDFHYRSFREKIAPLYVFIEPQWYSQFSIKMKTEDIPRTLAALGNKWEQLEPDFPFDYFFFDESFGNLYRSETNLSQLIRWFCILAVLITCLGLFGLSNAMVQRRIKEVGIRKILGASTPGLIRLLTRDFIVLLVISFVLAVPLAWYAMRQWLDHFAYRIEIHWWVFAVTGLGALVITLLTVGYKSIRAAWSNPVNSIRDE
ncbi:MAG: FtsX-like permease family protein [Saprospiraceae bacterium]